jgi:hypothetical protein
MMLYSTWRQSRDPAVAEEPPKASLPAQLLSKAVHGPKTEKFWNEKKGGWDVRLVEPPEPPDLRRKVYHSMFREFSRPKSWWWPRGTPNLW